MAARNQIFVNNAQVASVEARQRPDGANMTVLTVTVPARNNGATTLVVSSGAPAVQQKLQNIQQGMTVNLRANNLCAQIHADGSVVGYAQLTHISLGVQGEIADFSLVAQECSVGQFAPNVKTAQSGTEYVVSNVSEHIRKGKDGKAVYLNMSVTAFKQRFPAEFEMLAGASQGKRFTLVLDGVVITASPQKGNPILYGTVSSISENVPFVPQQGYQQGAPQQYAQTPAPTQPQNNGYQQGYAQPATAPAPQGYQQQSAAPQPQSTPPMGGAFMDDDDIPF